MALHFRATTCMPCVASERIFAKNWRPSTYYGHDMESSVAVREKYMNYVEQAMEEAKKSPMAQKHGCVIVHKNKLVSAGYNKLVEPFGSYSVHAEVNALLKAKKILTKSELKQSKLFIVRIGTDNMDNPLKYSKPCKVCQELIDRLGIKIVFYSTSEM